MKIVGVRHCCGEFCERKRKYVYDFATSAKLGGDILREHSGIGAGGICRYVIPFKQAIEDMVKCDVCVVAVIWMQMCYNGFGLSRKGA